MSMYGTLLLASAHVDERVEREYNVVMMIMIQVEHMTVYDSFPFQCHVASSCLLLAAVKPLAGNGSALQCLKLRNIESFG